MIYCKNLKKLIALIIIFTFVFQTNLFLVTQEDDDVNNQFELTKSQYMNGQYGELKGRLERLVGTILEKHLEEEKKDILGSCYLLLGAIFEKEGTTSLAEENYHKAKEQYGVESIDGVDLNGLPIYKRVEKGEIDIDTPFQKAIDEFNNGQYDNSKTSLEQVIGTITEKRLEVEKKEILGKCYLLLGVIYEKEGKTLLATENYCKAKREFGITTIAGVELNNLQIFKKIVNGIIEKECGGGKKIFELDPKVTSGEVIYGPKEILKKKKFPWILVAAGVVVVGALIYLATQKSKKTLTVTIGEGISGNPASGTHTYKKGNTVNYSYSAQSGYTALIVTLDGNPVASSGTILMDGNHILSVSADKIGVINSIKIRIRGTFAATNLQTTQAVYVDGAIKLNEIFNFDVHYSDAWEDAKKYYEVFMITRGLGNMEIRQIADSNWTSYYLSEESNIWNTSYDLEVMSYTYTGAIDPGIPFLSDTHVDLFICPWDTSSSGWERDQSKIITISAPAKLTLQKANSQQEEEKPQFRQNIIYNR